jgi:hypothetical protein
MSMPDRRRYDRPLGAKAYASMAEVEGLRLNKESSKRLERSKGMTQAKRRAEVVRAYTADKPRKK